MFHEYKHTCTNEADDDSSAIHIEEESLNVATACINQEKRGERKNSMKRNCIRQERERFDERLDIKFERIVVTDV